MSIDLNNCDKEPIHIPGAVQSFGSLIAWDSSSSNITRASKNIARLAGVEAEQLIGRPFSDLVEPSEVSKIDVTEDELRRQSVQLILRNGKSVDAFWRSAGGEQYLDILDHLSAMHPRTFLSVVRDLTVKLASASSEKKLTQAIVEQIRLLSDFDRVKVYKFDSHWNGEVVAEARKESVASYLGLHFPDSDIPMQARELYIRNRVRVIADVNDAQSPLIELPGLTPLDLSFSFIRSVSPIHLQYLRNMDVLSSMSISLLERGKFWGLIACHHESPRTFSFDDLLIYKTISDVCSVRLSDLSQMSDGSNQGRYLSIVKELIATVSETKQLQAMVEGNPSLDDLVKGTGVAVVTDQAITKRNAVPDEPTLRSLVSWLERGSNDVFSCDDLPARFGSGIGSYACGLLAAKIPNRTRAWLMWFRLEVTEEVSWAGDPYQPKAESPYGERLYPRTSFKIWKELRKGHSTPFQKWEEDAAHYLGRLVGALTF